MSVVSDIKSNIRYTINPSTYKYFVEVEERNAYVTPDDHHLYLYDGDDFVCKLTRGRDLWEDVLQGEGMLPEEPTRFFNEHTDGNNISFECGGDNMDGGDGPNPWRHIEESGFAYSLDSEVVSI